MQNLTTITKLLQLQQALPKTQIFTKLIEDIRHKKLRNMVYIYVYIHNTHTHTHIYNLT